jgi:hypothetical protein
MLEATILATIDRDVVLDVEIVCLDAQGQPQFYDLLLAPGRALVLRLRRALARARPAGPAARRAASAFCDR